MPQQTNEVKEKPFEVTLCEAASKLRGSVEPEEYRHVVPGISLIDGWKPYGRNILPCTAVFPYRLFASREQNNIDHGLNLPLNFVVLKT